VLYYCTAIISSATPSSLDTIPTPVNPAAAASASQAKLGYLYLTQGYIGIYFRQGVLSGVITKELYLLTDLQEVRLIDRSAAPAAPAPSSSSTTTRQQHNQGQRAEEEDGREGEEGSANATAASSSMFTSFQQSLGLSHLSYECELLFRRGERKDEGRGGGEGEEGRPGQEQLVTITPALISAEKLVAILLEAKDLVQTFEGQRSKK
jgi:hypothetical protein